MADEEQILKDVEEVESTGYLEAYVRFNDDFERDYCFQFKASDTFRSVKKIFHTLPLALRPNIFYDINPIGFKVSTSPGFLTEGGTVLFDYQAAEPRFLKNVSLDDKISDKIWPGQLIYPVWEFNYFAYYAFISLLIAWLYTDLPDSLSPTPGICLTNQVSLLTAKIATKFEFHNLARNLTEDLYEPASYLMQGAFFTFHVIKLLVIFVYINTGAFNPIKLNRFFGEKVNLDITREGLLSIGWTGSKKSPPDEYRSHYRKHKIDQAGGPVAAHQLGVLNKTKLVGCFLGKGEGYNTPLDTNATLKDLLQEDNPRFAFSYQYFAKIGQQLIRRVEEENADVEKIIKEYRVFGLFDPDPIVEKAVAQRKKYGDSGLSDLL